MKNFYGNIIGKNNELDWAKQIEVAGRGATSSDWSHTSSARVSSDKSVYWVSEKDGVMICHVWGANGGKLNIVDTSANNLIMTLSQPTANSSGPNRTWIPVYAGRELLFQNNSNYCTAYFIPYK
jgi:hypothetical protein